MKKYFLLLSFLLPLLVNAQTNKKSYALTEQDRKNYVLYIDQKSINNSSIIDMSGKALINLNLILRNNSNDTLKFLSMTCSWDDFYEIDKKNDKINGHNYACEVNISTIVSLAPHQTRSVGIPLFFTRNEPDHNYKFRIGMHLFKYSKKYDRSDFEELIATDKRVKKNLIWSNEVHL